MTHEQDSGQREFEKWYRDLQRWNRHYGLPDDDDMPPLEDSGTESQEAYHIRRRREQEGER